MAFVKKAILRPLWLAQVFRKIGFAYTSPDLADYRAGGMNGTQERNRR